MTLVATARTTGEPTNPTSSVTSASFTPAANALLFVAIGSNGGALGTVSSNTGGLSFTAVDTIGPTGAFQDGGSLYVATTGSSPSAMTVTITPTSGSSGFFYAIFDIAGSSPAIVSGQHVVAQSSAATITTGSLPSGATLGNMVVLVEAGNQDTAGTMNVPASWTVLQQPSGGGTNFMAGATVYNTAYSGTGALTFTNKNTGDSIQTFLLEVAETGGGGGGGPDANQAAPSVPFPGFKPPFMGPGATPLQLRGDRSSVTIVAVTLTDTGTGTDALTVAAAVTLTDVGAGADTLSVAAAVPLTDVGAGSDTISVAAAIGLSDTGSGSDNLGANNALALADTGTGTDAITVAVTVTLADTGTGTDAISVSTGSNPSLPDTGTGTDALTVAAAVPLAETGAGTDALSVSAAVTLTDTGTGTDAISVSGSSSPQLPDTATGTDSLSVTVNAGTFADTATGTDALSIVVTLAVADTGHGTDQFAAPTVTLPLAEVGAGTDNLGSIAVTVTVGTDAGHGTDALTVSIFDPTAHTPAERTYRVRAETRTLTVDTEPRTLTVRAESRVLTVEQP